MTKEHIEKVIRNNRSGFAAHQLFKEFKAAQKPLVDALTKLTKSVDALEGQEIEYFLGVQLAKDCIAAKAELAKAEEGK